MKHSSFMSTYYPKVLEGEGKMKIEKRKGNVGTQQHFHGKFKASIHPQSYMQLISSIFTPSVWKTHIMITTAEK